MTEPSFRRVLEIEASEELISFCCPHTGIPLWTALRQPVLRLFGISPLYGGAFVDTDYRVARGAAKKARHLARAAFHNAAAWPRLRGRGAITLSATGTGLVLESGRYFNRLSDHLLLAERDRSVSIEDSFDWIWPWPRANDRIVFRAPVQAAVALRGRALEPLYASRVRPFVELVAERVERILGTAPDAATRRWLGAVAARRLATAPYEVDAYRRMFRRLGTRILIKEEGCYGHAAPMIVAARDLGIVTAEHQHGLVSAGHDAYNFAPSVAASAAYRRTLPQYFLSYGSWWQDQINAPLAKVVIGNPHRDHRLRGWREGERSDILVLGDSIDRDFYRAFCRELAASAPPGLRVAFRPHPIERPQFAQEGERRKWQGIRIDDRPDIYDSFAAAAAVVGEMSTGLFEAAGLVPGIYVMDTAKSRFGMPDHPFAKIGGADELLDRLAGPGAAAPVDAEAIWASGWQQRYRDFIAGVAG